MKNEKSADLIVLPEAAVPFAGEKGKYDQLTVNKIFLNAFGPGVAECFPLSNLPYRDPESAKVSNAYWAQTLANYFQSDVIVGLDHEDENGQAYSSAFYVQPNRSALERYDKRILVPLVEYLPFAFLAPLVKTYGISEFFLHGQEAKIFAGKVPMSVSICYEETFPQNVREGRLKGAKMLINVTNDGWYPFTSLSSQHYEHARVRAIENGAPMLRACNTGISAAIDSLGRSVGKLEECREFRRLHAGVLRAEINPYEYQTLYTRWGNAGILTVCVGLLGVFVLLKKELQW